MRISQFLSVIALSLCLAPALSASPVNRLIEMHSDPDEFRLFNRTDSEIVSFQSEETVRICAGDGRHVTALRVTRDNQASTLKPGDCQKYTGQHFTLSPAGVVADNWNLTGTIEKAG